MNNRIDQNTMRRCPCRALVTRRKLKNFLIKSNGDARRRPVPPGAYNIGFSAGYVAGEHARMTRRDRDSATRGDTVDETERPAAAKGERDLLERETSSSSDAVDAGGGEALRGESGAAGSRAHSPASSASSSSSSPSPAMPRPPAAVLCPITMEPMNDPVTSPVGTRPVIRLSLNSSVSTLSLPLCRVISLTTTVR